MCGRFALNSPPALLGECFAVGDMPDLLPRHNIAPSQNIPIIRAPASVRECVLTRWGLVPPWSPTPNTPFNTINARAESVADKPAFRAAFRQRRCLVIADGFYEWTHAANPKQPYFITQKDRKPFAFAGLWERWEKDGQALESCTVIVTAANGLMRRIHDRMPVILSPDDYTQWLDAGIHDPAKIQPLLKPCPSEWLQAYPVSTAVNNVRNDSERLIRPVPLSPAAKQTDWFA